MSVIWIEAVSYMIIDLFSRYLDHCGLQISVCIAVTWIIPGLNCWLMDCFQQKKTLDKEDNLLARCVSPVKVPMGILLEWKSITLCSQIYITCMLVTAIFYVGQTFLSALHWKEMFVFQFILTPFLASRWPDWPDLSVSCLLMIQLPSSL